MSGLLNVDCRCKCVVSATPWVLYRRERALVPVVLVDRRTNLGGRGEEKISCAHRGFACRQSLYRLRYSGPRNNCLFCTKCVETAVADV